MTIEQIEFTDEETDDARDEMEETLNDGVRVREEADGENAAESRIDENAEEAQPSEEQD